MFFIAAVKDDGEMSNFYVKKNARNGMMPGNIILIEKVLNLPMEQFTLIEAMVSYLELASENIEHLRADVHNATKRILEESNAN